MNDIKIKPCPFCGNSEEVRVTQHGGYGVNCVCGGMYYDNHDTSTEAIKAWNIRKIETDKWINVEDSLPEDNSIPYFVFSIGGYYEIAKYSYLKNRWYTGTAWVDQVTHWMPLPDPPEK